MSHTIKNILEKQFRNAFNAAGIPNDSPTLVGKSVRPDLADYQANGVMAAAKKIKTIPRKLAEEVLTHLDVSELAEEANVAGPGFINIRLKNEWMAGRVEALNTKSDLIEKSMAPQKVVVDYSSPNLAKEMHVGHLRSTIIGDSMVRILDALGHTVIRQNHVGDWGTQFGMLIAYMIKKTEGGHSDIAHELADLEVFYQKAKKEFDTNEQFAAMARDYVVKLQSGDNECLAKWRTFVDASLAHCDTVYRLLDVFLTRADVRGESAYNDDLALVVSDLRAKGMLSESNGAQCVFLDEFKGKNDEPLPAIVQKSDGGFLYTTSDLAAVRYRCGSLAADRILYFVDVRQTLHLKQVFAVAKKAGFAPSNCRLEHHAFGTVMGSDGKPFKTRDGGTVKLIGLLAEAKKRAFEIVTQKNPQLPEDQRKDIAETVGIGAVKYADLSKNRTSDYIFDWDNMLSFEGNTAPYLQYVYARIKSIFRKGGYGLAEPTGTVDIKEPAERNLALKLLQFSETVDTVAQEGYPNVLCSYLFELASIFNTFYRECPVLKAADENVKRSRLVLCALSAKTIKAGLTLLGIACVEQM